MGAAACQCKSLLEQQPEIRDAETVQQNCCEVCVSSEQAEIGDVEEQDDAANLASFVLEPDAVDSLGDALDYLRDASKLFRDGLCTEAADKLAKAEALIDSSPSSASKKRISQVAVSDPELKELKQLTASNAFGMDGDDDMEENDTDQFGAPTLAAGSDEEESERQASSSSAEARRTEKMTALEVELSAVRALCREARIFEAHLAQEKLEASLAEAQKVAIELEDKRMAQVLQQLANKLKGDPVTVEAEDPKLLGEHFRLNVSLRFAEGDERVKDGPATQIIVRGELRNLPSPLTNVIVENCEVDLFQKEWIKDCKQFHGKCGRAPRLFCSLMQVLLSPPMLPIKIEDVILREFAVCKDGDLLPDLGPGVIVIEHRAPDGVQEFEGMPIPPKRRGIVRLKGGMTAFYKSRSVHPGDLLA